MKDYRLNFFPKIGVVTNFRTLYKSCLFVCAFVMLSVSMNAQTYDFTVTQPAIDDLVASGTGAAGINCDDGLAEMSVEVADAAFVCPDGSVANTTIGEGLNFVNVTIDLTHTFDADLNIALISPEGNVFILSDGNGGSEDNYTMTVFTDDAMTSINAGTPPFTGEFLAEDGELNVGLAGSEAEGTWTIQVCDDAGGDDGELLSGSMELAGDAAGCPIFCELECPADIIENLEAGECSTLITPNPVTISGEGCVLLAEPPFPPAPVNISPLNDFVALWQLTTAATATDPGFFLGANGGLTIQGGDSGNFGDPDNYAYAEYETPVFEDGSTEGMVCVTYDWVGEGAIFDNPFLAFSDSYTDIADPTSGFQIGTEVAFGTPGFPDVVDGVFCAPITTGEVFILGIYYDYLITSTVNFTDVQFISNIPDPTLEFSGLVLICETTDADGNVVDLAEAQGPGVYTTNCTGTDLTGMADVNEPVCSYSVTVNEYSGPVLSALTCNDGLNISVDDACNVEFNADMFLEGGPYACYDDYVVSIRPFGNEFQEFVPVGPQDFSAALGTHEFVITAPDGNSCWGEFTVEDKLGPAITVGDVTVSCIDPAVNLPVDATDNCGNVTVLCSDVTVPGSCETGIDRIITRTCVATDQNGRTSSATGTITVTTIGTGDITAPVTPVILPCGTGISPAEITEYFNDKIDTDGDGFPDTAINPTNASGPNCPSAENFERNEGITFGYFNYPSVGCDGNVYARQVDNNVCNLYTTYTDQEIPACAPGCNGNVKVIRTWTVLDWCSPAATPFTFIQIIKAVDTEAPTIEAEGFNVSVNPWNCLGDFSLPAPTLLHDLCTADLSYSVSGPAGTTLIAPNTPANQTDFWVVFGAPKTMPGQPNIFTYTASDCCGNTSSVDIEVNVYDTTPPTPIATQNIIVNLTTSGQPDENGNAGGVAKIFNTSVNNGSYDGCSDVRIEIRREESPVACGYSGNSTYATNDDFPNAGDTNPTRADYDPDNGEYVKFCCADITDVDPVTGVEFGLVPVRMRVFDDGNMNGILGDWVDADNDGVQDAGEYDNFNETWVTVRVEGKAIASIVCPPDVTLACDMDYTDPAMIGTATTLALCGSESVDVTFNPQLDACGVGFVIATYTVVGSSNPVISCNQRIDIENPYPAFDPAGISYPRNLPTNATQQIACDDAIAFAPPTWTAGACDFIGYTEDVDTFFFEVDPITGAPNDACFKILRSFTVIDWCVYDATNGQDGLYYGSQTIKITDRDAPVLNNCAPAMFDVDGDCVRTSTVLTNNATDAGNCASDWLKWQVFVDTWGDNVIDYEYSSFLPTNDSNISNDTNGNGINDRYLAPTTSGEDVSITVSEVIESSMFNHKVTWKVTDGCGNVASCETTFMVVDKKAPTPYCVSLSTALMENGGVDLWAIDFDLGAFDNCTDQENLRFTFSSTPPEDDNNYIADLRSSSMTFNTAGVIPVNVYVWDEKGNADFCSVMLTVIDNNGSGLRAAGITATELGNGVAEATVSLDAAISEFPRSTTTDASGDYAFLSNPNGVDYEITVNKNDDHTNGVSTLDLVLIQRHIVGFADLDSPYKVIAADINGDDNVSSIDVVELRKVVLGVQDEFTSNTSWRFVDATQTFADITSPWPVDETRAISNLSTDMDAENFVAVKVGDVNATATNNVAGATTEVRSGATMLLEVSDRAVVAGEQVEIAVNSADFNAVSGLQMTVEFNGLTFNDVAGKAIAVGASNVGVISDNVITMSWSANTAVSTTDDLFVITAVATKDGNISEMIKVTDRVITPEVYVGSSLEVQNVELGIRGANGLALANELMQNEPNPFKQSTAISFNLATAGKASLTIRDVAGKVIRTVNGEYAAGMNTISIEKSDINTVGVLYYTIESGDFSETKKMIIIE